MPLESTLDNGDVVEVFTSKAPNAGPSRDWLAFVKSPRARNKIRQWFTKERREEAIEQGKEQIARLMRKEGVPLKRVLTHETLSTVAAELRLADVSALYAAVGEGNVGAQTVVRRVIDLFGGEEGAAEDLAEGVRITDRARARKRRPRGDAGVIVKGIDPTSGSSSPSAAPGARRRHPRLRDPRRRGVGAPRGLHQRHEPQAQPERLVEVEWAPTAQSMFLVNIQVEALDRARLLSDITKVLSDVHVNILAASLHDQPRPGREEPVHVRDGRPQAPRSRAQGGPPRRRRLRRLPRHPVAVTLRAAGRQPVNSWRRAFWASRATTGGPRWRPRARRPSSRCRRPRPYPARSPGPAIDDSSLADGVGGAGPGLGVGPAPLRRPRLRGSPARPCGCGPRGP